MSEPLIVEYLLSGVGRGRGQTYSLRIEPFENYHLSECVMLVPEAPIGALPADHGFWNWNAPNFVACQVGTGDE